MYGCAQHDHVIRTRDNEAGTDCKGRFLLRGEPFEEGGLEDFPLERFFFPLTNKADIFSNVKAVHDIFFVIISIVAGIFFSLQSGVEQASHVNFQNREHSALQWFLRP